MKPIGVSLLPLTSHGRDEELSQLVEQRHSGKTKGKNKQTNKQTGLYQPFKLPQKRFFVNFFPAWKAI